MFSFGFQIRHSSKNCFTCMNEYEFVYHVKLFCAELRFMNTNILCVFVLVHIFQDATSDFFLVPFNNLARLATVTFDP